ncbi:MAG: helix-turn-helix transcriptional regulator [Ruminococcaceae bacterium]|nr:helix-turn-helix transcriptional regulator [Oscillospiraceae bacterium]
MILADKILNLRKKNGWSQEELAEKLGVSRQSVSKWEGAQSLPDLDRIVQMAKLFDVTTDYLLREEQEEETHPAVTADEKDSALRRITMEEANAFLEAKYTTAPRIALGVLLCILSPVSLFILSGAAEYGFFPFRNSTGMMGAFAAGEGAAVCIGLIILLAMVAAAVIVFIKSGELTRNYQYLETEPFETAYGVDGMLRQRRDHYRGRYMRSNILGVCLCVLSPVWLFLGLFTDNGMVLVFMLSLLMATAGFGVFELIRVGIPWSAMQKLLQEDEYSVAAKQRRKRLQPVSTAYWSVATAAYLGWSFLSDAWEITWVVWPVAGVLYAAVMALCAAFMKSDTDK